MAKKKNTDEIAEMLAAALNASFQFGIAHAQAVSASIGAERAQEEAMRLSQDVANLLIPRKKKDLN